MSNFTSLNTALTGLRAAQVGIEVTSHNISNVNTKGYTRQRVDQSARAPFQSPVGPLGTGVEITSISRTRDAFLDARARASFAQFASLDTRAALLQRAEAAMGEPDQGISGELAEVWAAFEDLAMEPQDLASRRQVLSSLDALASRVRTVTAGWDTLAADTAVKLEGTVDEINSSLTRLAQLNKEIPTGMVRGTPPNDLLNERDLMLDKLSSLAGVSITVNSDGTADVRSGGTDLVVREQAHPLEVVDTGTTKTIRVASTGTVVTPAGETGGLQRFYNTELPGLRNELTTFVTDLANSINTAHASGYRATTPPGSAPGGPLLGFDPALGPGAAGFVVVANGPDELAPAAAPGPAGQPPGANDGGNAQAMAALRNGTDASLRSLIVGLGRNVASATRAADAQESLTNAVDSARMSVHGVSIDEEMVSLVTYQRALEASSRVMSTIDEMLNVLINRTGIVGR